MNIRKIPQNVLLAVIRLLCISALLFASALAVDYYFNANTFCAEGHSCDVVAHSEFGQKYGIFLPTLGLLMYTFVFFASLLLANPASAPSRLLARGPYMKSALISRLFTHRRNVSLWLPLIIFASALGAILFIFVQAFEIDAFCWLCMGIDSSAIAMLIPAILLAVHKYDDAPDDGSAVQDAPTTTKTPKTFLHPLVWTGIFIAAAGGPLSWGSFQPPAKKGDVPEYIASFYKQDKINIVEVSSFECPHCRELHPVLSSLVAEYGDDVNFKRITLPRTPRKEACVAYLCAERQNRSEQYADCLFNDATHDPDKLLDYARECSVKEDEFKECVMDPATSAYVDQCLTEIMNMGFDGFPTVWIGDSKIVGYNRDKGDAPYRDAISSGTSALSSTLPLAFIFTLILAGSCILAGFSLSLANRKV